MPQLIWSRRALHDLERLRAFLILRNRDTAGRAIRSIRSSAKLLVRHPHIGRQVDGMPSEMREWFVDFGGDGYVMMYHFDGRRIVVLGVRHGKEAGF